MKSLLLRIRRHRFLLCAVAIVITTAATHLTSYHGYINVVPLGIVLVFSGFLSAIQWMAESYADMPLGLAKIALFLGLWFACLFPWMFLAAVTGLLFDPRYQLITILSLGVVGFFAWRETRK